MLGETREVSELLWAPIAQKKGLTTMPDSEKTPKDRIDGEAGKALAKVDRLLADPKAKDLNAELNEIKTSLMTIRGDPHKAR
jgi:hypothetical protein